MPHALSDSVPTLNVNLMAGPGVGKSVLMSQLFATLKLSGVHCEMCPEYAKELVYEGRIDTADQLWILAEQHRRQARLQGRAQVVVTDSSLHVSLAYVEPEVRGHFEALVAHATRDWACLNVLLHRDLETGYEQAGRYQSKEAARAFHDEVVVPHLRRALGGQLIELDVEQALPALQARVHDWLSRRR